MKRKKTFKSLTLHKTTVANLNNAEMGAQRGGDDVTQNLECLTIQWTKCVTNCDLCPTNPGITTCTMPSRCPCSG